MAEPDPAANRALVERYFEMMQTGSPEIESLFDQDVCWVAPQSSPVGRRHEGKAAVLALMGTGVGLYDMSQPMNLEVEAIAAEGDRVFVELSLAATTGAGQPYRNDYVFVFRIAEGRIIEIHEHLDTLYTQRMLFDPVGQKSPLDAPG
jgi:ketosteroid isomerase-like protein